MRFEVLRKGESLGHFILPMFGRHLVQNCTAAIGVGLEFGISPDTIRAALAAFGGVKRRLEVIGESRGVTVMNDYGHHPTEIRATLSAVRECCGSQFKKLWVLFQPHRYTRTQLCWNEYLSVFKEADTLILTDIYAASEKPIEGVSGRSFFDAVDHSRKEYVEDLEEVSTQLVSRLEAGDLVLCLGAGSVGAMPDKLLKALDERIDLPLQISGDAIVGAVVGA
jgi:UDP-N-acetylmuramate--alanine ligase